VFCHGAVYFRVTSIPVWHVKYGSARNCRQKFRHKFRDERLPSKQTIHTLVNKLRTTGLLIDKKQKYKHRVLTEEKLHDIGARLEHTPRKLQKRLAQETGASKSNVRRATQLLKLGPYKTIVIMLCSHAIRLVAFICSLGFYSLSSKVRSIRNWHSFLMKHGLTCRNT
jgi:hypothetical protein